MLEFQLGASLANLIISMFAKLMGALGAARIARAIWLRLILPQSGVLVASTRVSLTIAVLSDCAGVHLEQGRGHEVADSMPLIKLS